MNGNLSDIELFRQVLRENNPRAFGMLMQRYSLQVYSAALRLMHDEEEATEVTQMAFIQAYKQLDSWQGGNFGSWVTVIANHIGLRLLEKEKRRRFRTGAASHTEQKSLLRIYQKTCRTKVTTSRKKNNSKPWSKR